MKRREMKLLLEERFERIALLETRIDTMDQLVEGYRAREQAILDTLQSARDNASQIVEQAKAEAQQLREDAEKTRTAAKAEADALRRDAASASDALKAEAERRAKEIMITAKAESDRMLRDAEIMKREYEEMVDLFNSMLEHNASELQTSATRFAEFMKSSKIDTLDSRSEGDMFYKSVGALRDVSLPDPSGDPSRLMQNIYRIQNRTLPEDKPNQQADEGEAAQAGTEPFSEAAWANDKQESPTEPQAEFTKAFDNAYAESAFVVRADGCHFTQEQAEHLFDALFTAPDFGQGTEAAKAAPAATDAAPAAADGAQQQEAERAFDALYQETLAPESGETADANMPAGQRAQEEVAEALQQGPEGAATPYSEAAWANETASSGYEPQAEFAPAFGAEAEQAFDDFFQRQGESISPVAETAPAEPQAEQPAEEPEDEIYHVELTEEERRLYQPAPETQQAPQSPQEMPTAETVVAPAEAASVFDAAFEAAEDAYIPATENAAAPESPAVQPIAYSEAAWGNDAQSTGYEPQAEFSPAFGAQSIAEGDAERAFDLYIKSCTFEPAAENESAPAPSQDAEAAPYSAAAWANEAQRSDFEPQAEFSPAFGGDALSREAAAAKNEFAVEASRAFDDLIGSDAAAQNADAQPAPYSSAAWASGAFTSGHEPQAEGALFSASEPADEETQPDEPASSGDTMRAIDDLLSGYGALTAPASEPKEAEHVADVRDAFAPEPRQQETPAAAQPAPYSEAAWSQFTLTSDHEPQAEGSLFTAEETEAEEPAPAPRRYSDYGEVREWEPEPEPDLGDLPTVSRYVGENQQNEEISLDALLDEIIKAGD